MSVRSIDLSRIMEDAPGIELTDWQRHMIERLPTHTLRFSGYWVTGRAWAPDYLIALDQLADLWVACRKHRLSRMRTAYHRRRS